MAPPGAGTVPQTGEIAADMEKPTKKDKEEKRKQQIREILDKTMELRDLILNSEDYIRYRKELETLKESEKTYRRLNEFRRKNIDIQLLEDESRRDELARELYSEYADVLNLPLVERFMITEQTICKTMRKVQNQVFDGIDLDISYMD